MTTEVQELNARAVSSEEKVEAVVISGPDKGRIFSLPLDEAKNALAARELAAAEEALELLGATMNREISPREADERFLEIKRKYRDL